MFVAIKKASAWTFDTSEAYGIGAGIAMAERGAIYLKDPSGKPATFYYGAPGVGFSDGVKMPKSLILPKFGKLNVGSDGVGASFAPTAFPNKGQMYVLPGTTGNELTAADIRGMCIFCEVSGGVIAGASATAMILGIDPISVYTMGLNPDIFKQTIMLYRAAVDPLAALPIAAELTEMNFKAALHTAKGLLVMAGASGSLSVGAGAGAYLGLMF